MKIQKWLVGIAVCIVAFVQVSADGNRTKKYNTFEMENSKLITLQEFDEWLKVNDHYEVFIKAYNTSPDHPTVIKMKCLYELESLQSVGSEMSYDEMLEKCSPK